MKRIDGSGLWSWLRSARRRWPEVLERFRQAGCGLAAAHAVVITHRDFEPDNALIDTDGRVAVSDFGLARLSESPLPVEASADEAEAVTMSGPLVAMSNAGLLVLAVVMPAIFAAKTLPRRSDFEPVCRVGTSPRGTSAGRV